MNAGMAMITTTTTAVAGEPAAARQPAAEHVAYLNGIRGLAALYVLLEHVQLAALDLVGARQVALAEASGPQQFARFLNAAVLGYGHLAVDVFIVLSGYCLMLPVAASADGELRGGLKRYLRRRATRVLPPYFAALFVAIGVYVFMNGGTLPSPGNLVSHLLLVHNVTPQWLYGITPPLWSIAVEWQIYFIFAMVLLPVWRRGGELATLLVATTIGVLPLYLLPARSNFEWSCPWYVALFASGMVTAVVATSSVRRTLLLQMPWNALTIAAGVGTIGAFALQRVPGLREMLRMQHRGGSWLLDVMVGVTVSAALLSLARTAATGHGRTNLWAIRVLQARPVAIAGDFSYSLYLIHVPIVTLVSVALAGASLSPAARYVSMYLVGVPSGLAAGGMLYLAVERYCVRNQRQRAGSEEHEQVGSRRQQSGEVRLAVESSVPVIAPAAH